MEANKSTDVDRKAGGPAISSDDGKYLQEFEPGFNTLGTPKVAADPSALTRKPPRCSCRYCREWIVKLKVSGGSCVYHTC